MECVCFEYIDTVSKGARSGATLELAEGQEDGVSLNFDGFSGLW